MARGHTEKYQEKDVVKGPKPGNTQPRCRERVEPVGETPQKRGLLPKDQSLAIPSPNEGVSSEDSSLVIHDPVKKGYYQRIKAW